MKNLPIAIFLFATFSSVLLHGQCLNNSNFPATLFVAPSNYDTLTVSTQTFGGDYARAHQFISGETYRFTSSRADDLITIRTFDRDSVLAFGTQPLDYTIASDTAITIHVNPPDCSIQLINRTTKIIHVNIPDLPNVGINTADPLASLDVNGSLRIASDFNPPVAGMLRFNPDTQDFEGYDGSKWRSFSKPSAIWGQQLAPTAGPSAELTLPNLGFGAQYGREIDIDDTWLAIAAPFEQNGQNPQEGSVYMLQMENGNYTIRQKLVANAPTASDQYGQGGLDVAGSTLIIGSPNADYQSSVGKAEIWEEKNGVWSRKAELGNGHPNNNYHFALDVATDGEFAAVRNADIIQGIDQVFIYKKIGLNWTVVDTLISPTTSATFGDHLEWNNSQLYVGDSNNFYAGNKGGRITIYDMDGNNKAILADSILNPAISANFGDKFGVEFDIQGNNLIVGSPGYLANNVFRSGAAYIYNRVNSSWGLEHYILENTVTEFSDFGTRVSIYEDHAVISVNGYLEKPGKTYVYKYGESLNLEATLMDGDYSNNDIFGQDLEIHGNTIFVGAPNSAVQFESATGKVHIFCK